MICSISDHIIVVDDTSDFADVLAERLRIAGFENITVYNDPREALKAIRGNTRPAIVITDFNMPNLTGVKLLDEIEQHHPEIDGVVITGDISAAMEHPHRYLIFDKSTNTFYQKLIVHTLGIIRFHIRPLIDACPAGTEKPDCPFKGIRTFSVRKKMEWIEALQPADIRPLVRHHQACINNPADPDCSKTN